MPLILTLQDFEYPLNNRTHFFITLHFENPLYGYANESENKNQCSRVI